MAADRGQIDGNCRGVKLPQMDSSRNSRFDPESDLTAAKRGPYPPHHVEGSAMNGSTGH